MDTQTIAIIAVGVGLVAAYVPLLIWLLNRIYQLRNEVARIDRIVTALANHHHGDDGSEPRFILPPS